MGDFEVELELDLKGGIVLLAKMNKHKCMVLGNQKCPHTPARAQASTYAFKLTFISKLGCKMRTGMVKYSEIISKRRQSSMNIWLMSLLLWFSFYNH
ncbi:hypothetical protein NC652_011296 [Populus alba x Populus x berolinensis]|nr:hypothetical protein NC652_011296 [Populus alba x Populus x berolinensis]